MKKLSLILGMLCIGSLCTASPEVEGVSIFDIEKGKRWLVQICYPERCYKFVTDVPHSEAEQSKLVHDLVSSIKK